TPLVDEMVGRRPCMSPPRATCPKAAHFRAMPQAYRCSLALLPADHVDRRADKRVELLARQACARADRQRVQGRGREIAERGRIGVTCKLAALFRLLDPLREK